MSMNPHIRHVVGRAQTDARTHLQKGATMPARMTTLEKKQAASEIFAKVCEVLARQPLRKSGSAAESQLKIAAGKIHQYRQLLQRSGR